MDRPPKLDRGKYLSNLIPTIPAFVGRGQQPARIEAHLQDPIAAHPRVMLGQGAAGIRKTWLLEEVRSRVLRHSIRLDYSRCYEDLSPPCPSFVPAFCTHLQYLSEDGERRRYRNTEGNGRLRSSMDFFGLPVFSVANMAMREPETRLSQMIARLQREVICQTSLLPGRNKAEIYELTQGTGLVLTSHQLKAAVNGATL
jgi:hypothetical protein